MNEILSIKQAAEYLNLSYKAVFSHRLEWGFFKMKGSRTWRVEKSTLDLNRQKIQNASRLCVQVGDKERKCRSEKTKMGYGRSILLHQAGNEFDCLVKRLRKN